MVCDRHINLVTVADAALRPFTAGTFYIKYFIRDPHLTNRLHFCMWLLKTFAIPAGMYARFGPTYSYNSAKKSTVLYKDGY